MILDSPGCVGHDAFEDFSEADNSNLKVRFFFDFPEQGLFQLFTGFDGAAGQAPKAFKGLFAALDEQDAGAVKNQGPDAKDGLGRIAPDVGWNYYSVTAPLTFILAR